MSDAELDIQELGEKSPEGQRLVLPIRTSRATTGPVATRPETLEAAPGTQLTVL